MKVSFRCLLDALTQGYHGLTPSAAFDHVLSLTRGDDNWQVQFSARRLNPYVFSIAHEVPLCHPKCLQRHWGTVCAR